MNIATNYSNLREPTLLPSGLCCLLELSNVAICACMALKLILSYCDVFKTPSCLTRSLPGSHVTPPIALPEASVDESWHVFFVGSWWISRWTRSHCTRVIRVQTRSRVFRV